MNVNVKLKGGTAGTGFILAAKSRGQRWLPTCNRDRRFKVLMSIPELRFI